MVQNKIVDLDPKYPEHNEKYFIHTHTHTHIIYMYIHTHWAS